MLRLTHGALLLAAFAPACSSQGLTDDVGWTPVQEQVDGPSANVAPAGQQTLGSPFLVAANYVASPQEESPGQPSAAPTVGGTRFILVSDACDVSLEAVHIDVLPAGQRGAPVRLSSPGAVVGRVLASSPHSLRAVFEVPLDAAISANGSPSWRDPDPAEVLVDATEAGDGVVTTVRVNLGTGTISHVAGGSQLDFTAWGAFTADQHQVPARSWECW